MPARPPHPRHEDHTIRIDWVLGFFGQGGCNVRQVIKNGIMVTQGVETTEGGTGQCGESDGSEVPGAGPRRVIAWARAEHAALLSHVAHHAGLVFVAAGSPADVAGEGEALAKALDAPRCTDIRHTVQTTGADLLLLLTLHGLDLGAAQTGAGGAVAGGRLVLSMEPWPAGAYPVPAREDVGRVGRTMRATKGAGSAGTGGGSVHWGCRLRYSRGGRALADVLESFGTPLSASITVFGRHQHGDLLARLMDAVDFLEGFCGETVTVDAGYRPTTEPGRGSGSAVPASVSGLRGYATANLRLANGCTATISASDAAGCWGRRAILHSPAGTIDLSDDHFHWWAASGRNVESTSFPELELALPEVRPPEVRGTLFPALPEGPPEEGRSAKNARKLPGHGRSPSRKGAGRKSAPLVHDVIEIGGRTDGPEASREHDASHPTLVTLITSEIRRLFDPAQAAALHAEAPWRNAKRLEAVCETIRLSMQTGQVESAEKIARVMEA